MFYRYDPNNIDCEVFQYARQRATVFYRYHKSRFCGDVDDLQQTAMMAIVEAVATVEDKSQVPEELMMDCVDKALRNSIQTTKKQSPVTAESATGVGADLQHTVNYAEAVPSQDSIVLTGRAVVKMKEFREFLEKILTPEKLDILWQVMVLGFSEQDVVNKLLEKQQGSGKWDRPTIGKVKRLLAEATSTIRLKMPDDLITEIAKLKVERE